MGDNSGREVTGSGPRRLSRLRRTPLFSWSLVDQHAPRADFAAEGTSLPGVFARGSVQMNWASADWLLAYARRLACGRGLCRRVRAVGGLTCGELLCASFSPRFTSSLNSSNSRM